MNPDTSRKARPMVNDVVADHERIWLQNAADGEASGEGRMWCQDKVWPVDENDGEPTEYVRADIHQKALDLIADQAARLEEVTRERDEARSYAGPGCDAADGGAHSIIEQGNYRFCGACGYTIKSPTLTERVRRAEAALTAAEAENERYLAALQAADATLTERDAFALTPIVGSDNPHEHAAGLVRAALSPKKEQGA